MSKNAGRRVIRPESEDRGEQAAEVRRHRRGRIPAGDEGIAPNPDAHPVEEFVEDEAVEHASSQKRGQ